MCTINCIYTIYTIKAWRICLPPYNLSTAKQILYKAITKIKEFQFTEGKSRILQKFPLYPHCLGVRNIGRSVFILRMNWKTTSIVGIFTCTSNISRVVRQICTNFGIYPAKHTPVYWWRLRLRSVHCLPFNA